MANYIINNSKFTPFTFQEMIAPLNMYKEAYDKVDTELVNLDVITPEYSDEILGSHKDSYRQYQQDLLEAQDKLYTDGLGAAKPLLNKLKRQYTNIVKPVDEAYKRLVVDQQQIANFKRTNPNTIVTTKDNVSIDDYMEGKTPSMEVISLDDILNKSAKEFQSSSSRITNRSGWYPILGDTYLENKNTIGIDEFTLNNALNTWSNAYIQGNTNNLTGIAKDINTVFENVKTTIPNFDHLSSNDKLRILNNFTKGIKTGVVYKTDYERVKNPNYKEPSTDNPNSNPSNTETTNVGLQLNLGARTNYENPNFSEGLKPTGNGKYTSARLEEAASDITNFVENMNSLMSVLGISSTANISQKAQKLKDFGFGKDSGWTLYTKIQKAFPNSKALVITMPYINKINNAFKVFNDYEILQNEYSYTGFTPYENISLGATLEDERSSDNIAPIIYNSESTEANKVYTGVVNVLNSLTEKQFESNNIGLVDSEGESMDYDTFKEMRDNKDAVGIRIDNIGDNRLVLTYNGKDYHIKGSSVIDSFNNELGFIDTYLKNFKLNNLPVNNITSEEFNDIVNGNKTNYYTYNIMDEENNNSNRDMYSKYISKASQYKGAAFVVNNSDGSKDVIKLLLDKNGNIMAVNSINNEIAGGQLRYETFRNMSQRGLSELKNIFSVKQ